MTTDGADTEAQTLPPDDAFAVLGNETRMEILRALGEADGPLSFSQLRERVGMRDSGQFNYHLDEVEGHFAAKTDEGYVLRETGRMVVEAVLSGAVTRAPVMDPARIDDPCPLCGGPAAVAYEGGQIKHYCTECEGHYGPVLAAHESATSGGESDGVAKYGFLGAFQLPPAGLQGRTPSELFRAAAVWGIVELLATASGVCPRCSAPLADSVSVCEAHDSADGLCDRCENRHAIHADFGCTNCLFEVGGALAVALVADLDVLAFLIDHGINPVSPSSPAVYNAALMDYDEELLSADPFEARVTLSVDGDTLALTVDGDLNVRTVTQG